MTEDNEDPAPASQEKDPSDFGLTEPEPGRYEQGKPFRFLVHVPLGELDRRFEEIGSERDGILMASLIDESHPDTFEGRGGFLLAQPAPEGIRGTWNTDAAAVTHEERTSAEQTLSETRPLDYNEVDLNFDATRVVGVCLRVRPDGTRIGPNVHNTWLEQVAKERNLPVVEVVVPPRELPTEVGVIDEQLPDRRSSMKTYNIPNDSQSMYRVQVASFAEGANPYFTSEDKAVRAMKIDQYGEVERKLSEADAVNITRHLGGISEVSEHEAIQKELVKASSQE